MIVELIVGSTRRSLRDAFKDLSGKWQATSPQVRAEPTEAARASVRGERELHEALLDAWNFEDVQWQAAILKAEQPASRRISRRGGTLARD
jgi:hypothetical protein